MRSGSGVANGLIRARQAPRLAHRLNRRRRAPDGSCHHPQPAPATRLIVNGVTMRWARRSIWSMT